jgi:F0F1-type ATP synthase assembly protein I
VVNALLVLLLVVLVVFPSQLFNRTYEENHEAITSWVQRRMPWTAAARGGRARWRRAGRGAAAFAVVIVVGALLGTLLDTTVGFNARSAALFLGLALAMVLMISVAAAAIALYRRLRGHPAHWELRALPSALVVTAVCVLVSRVTSFHPGYLYGVIGGVAFAGRLGRHEEGHTVAVASLATLVVAVAAWLAWVPVADAASRPGAGFQLALAEDFLAGVFVGGLVGVVIGLVPLRFLPGQKLAAWHWGAWAAVFAVAAMGLLQVMLRPQSAAVHGGGVPFWTTLGLFLAFGAASVGFWGYWRLRSAEV